MRPRLLRQPGARDAHRRSGKEQLRVRRHQRHPGVAPGVAAPPSRAMPSAPAFELPLRPRRAEKGACGVLGAATAGALAAWLGSRFENATVGQLSLLVI